MAEEGDYRQCAGKGIHHESLSLENPLGGCEKSSQNRSEKDGGERKIKNRETLGQSIPRTEGKGVPAAQVFGKGQTTGPAKKGRAEELPNLPGEKENIANGWEGMA